MPGSFRIVKLSNVPEWHSEPKPYVQIEQSLLLVSDGPATIIIEQHIDDMTMIEGVRYPIQEGMNTLQLKPMRIYNPTIRLYDGTPAAYTLAVRVYAAGIDPVTVSETLSFHNPEEDNK